MENDSIRASGTDTLVDIWVNSELRAICVRREAIDNYIGFEAARMSEDDRCEFVRKNLPLVVTAVKTKLRNSNPAADTVTIEGGQLGGDDAGGIDRRKRERRKTERRKVTKPKEQLPHGERRRTDRRKTERRRPPGK